MILAEPEPIGAFVGIAVSEPVLQGGNLLSVFGYMFYVEPLLALISIAMFSPQFVFVPLMQRAINRRVQSRILVLRQRALACFRRRRAKLRARCGRKCASPRFSS